MYYIHKQQDLDRDNRYRCHHPRNSWQGRPETETTQASLPKSWIPPGSQQVTERSDGWTERSDGPRSVVRKGQAQQDSL